MASLVLVLSTPMMPPPPKVWPEVEEPKPDLVGELVVEPVVEPVPVVVPDALPWPLESVEPLLAVELGSVEVPEGARVDPPKSGPPVGWAWFPPLGPMPARTDPPAEPVPAMGCPKKPRV